jgi:hypothetical protein
LYFFMSAYFFLNRSFTPFLSALWVSFLCFNISAYSALTFF